MVDELELDRRRLLAWLTAGSAAISMPFGFARPREGRIVKFLVAGVRFQDPLPHLDAGIAVEVVGEVFREATCYGVYSGTRRLGCVPRDLVPAFGEIGLLRGRLEAVHESRFPWRRYEVALTLPNLRA